MEPSFITLFSIVIGGFASLAQNNDADLSKSNALVYKANTELKENFVVAETDYRKALSKQPSNIAGIYNLGNAYFENEKFSEAMMRHEEVVKKSTDKETKHKAYHNMGNALMKVKKCKEAVEAYKNALRNNPEDEETRYNFALAKQCAKEQGGGGDGEDQDKEDKEDQNQKDQKEDEGQNENQKQKEDDKKDSQKEDKKEDEKQGDNRKNRDDEKEGQKKPQQKAGQLSPQQIKNILKAMNDHEEKVQDKVNMQKIKGGTVKSDKDW